MNTIDRAEFAKECVKTGIHFGVSPHYLLAIAQIRSGISDEDDGDKIGPYRVTQTEWNATPPQPDIEFTIMPGRIRRMAAQVTRAGVMTYKAQQELMAGQPEDKEIPSALDIYDKWPNDPAKRADLQQALDDTANLVEPAMIAVLGESGPVSGTVGADSGMPAGDTVGTLTPGDYQKFCNVLGHMESGNKYNTKNSIGFVGRWQFGAGALQDSRNVRAGVNKNSGLNSAGAWTGKDGVSSLSDWLTGPNAKIAQDNAMQIYTQKHFQQLTPDSIPPGSAPAHIAGMLAASHLMGVGGARNLLKGKITHDANSTTTLKYYGILSQAFDGPARPPGV